MTTPTESRTEPRTDARTDLPTGGPSGAAPGGRSGVTARAVVVLALATGAAWLLGRQLPLLGPMLSALALGALLTNGAPLRRLVGEPAAGLDRNLLRTGVALLGLRVALGEVLDLGVGALVVAAGTVAVTFSTTRWLGRRLGVGEEQTTLVAAGFSICGAAAVAGVQGTVRAKPREVGLAVSLVTLFGSAMIVLLPALAGLLGLSDLHAGVWAGAAIHEVAQVVAAGALLGGGTALAVATTVKLCRVALLAPVQLVLAHQSRRSAPEGARPPLVPWFVLAFLAAVALRSTGWLPAAAVEAGSTLARVLLVAAMVGLGRGIDARDLWPLPGRLLALATAATVVVTSTALGLTLLLV